MNWVCVNSVLGQTSSFDIDSLALSRVSLRFPLRPKMSNLCCGCLGKKENESSDYLLPGGAWDPSLSQSTASNRSRHSTRSAASVASIKQRPSNSSLSSIRSLLSGGGWRGRLNRTQSSNEDLESNRGDYQPPPLVPSRTLPTIEEFKLLRTVGKGAFGKVQDSCILTWITVSIKWVRLCLETCLACSI